MYLHTHLHVDESNRVSKIQRGHSAYSVQASVENARCRLNTRQMILHNVTSHFDSNAINAHLVSAIGVARHSAVSHHLQSHRHFNCVTPEVVLCHHYWWCRCLKAIELNIESTKSTKHFV